MRVYPCDATPTWDVWHVRRCCVPCDVLWVDSDSARWCQLDGNSEPIVHQAARIHIFPHRLLVLIDPVRDVDAVIARVSRR